MRAATTFLLIAGLLAQQPSFAEPRERVGKSPWGADDLKGALHRHEGRLEEGDVVLIRTGQASHYQDAAKYLHEYPGVSLEAVKWLV